MSHSFHFSPTPSMAKPNPRHTAPARDAEGPDPGTPHQHFSPASRGRISPGVFRCIYKKLNRRD